MFVVAEMVETCFGGKDGLVNDLNSLLCDTQSCHHQLHSLLNPAKSIHEGREDWDFHHDQINSIGYPLILFIVVALAYFSWTAMHTIVPKRKKRSKKLKMKKFD